MLFLSVNKNKNDNKVEDVNPNPLKMLFSLANLNNYGNKSILFPITYLLIYNINFLGVQDYMDEETETKYEAVDPNAPKIRVSKKMIVASEGSVTTLRVYVTGSPRPDVYWRKRGQPYLDTRVGKYQVIRGGSLQVSNQALISGRLG